MGIQDLQKFLESTALDGGSVSVDLLRIARNITQRPVPPQQQNRNNKVRPIGNKLKLVLDGECCLDRLYGGFFSDWACGGQWNRMVQFLSLLMHAVERGNIELAVVFNGTLEPQRMSEWVAEQAKVRHRVGMVIKHINTKGTPPPKVWWTAPTCLKTALRMALRHLDTAVMCTMDDHHQEVIAYCRENNFHGLMADDAEYAAFDPPRYFSAANLKLTYKGSLETKEFMVGELCKSLKLTQEQICVLAALLGNYLLLESELQDLYKKIGVINPPNTKLVGEELLKCVANYVRDLPPPSNLDALVTKVIGPGDEKKANALRQSIQYYLNGTASGFLRYCAPTIKKENIKVKGLSQNNNNLNNVSKTDDHDLDTSGFASETTEQEQESLQKYKLATANAVIPSDIGIVLDDSKLDDSPPSSDTSRLNGHSSNYGSSGVNSSSTSTAATGSNSNSSAGTKINLLVSSASSNTSSLQASPRHSNTGLPSISADVLRTASLRHQKGLMAPMIWHVLNGREVRLPCLMEDETSREFAPIHDIFKSLRQRVYAVLFNLHHLRYVHAKKRDSGEIPDNTPQPEVTVREWVYSRANPYQHTEHLKAEPLPWAVPTLQRLWFGPALDDKRRRMRALLSCLNSDTPLILNTSYVPQQMLVMACVLRYIMSQPDRCVLRRQELDAFLCQAFSPDLMNAQYLQELTLNVVTSRGVQLAALFMQGVEMALVANDACGAPLPWLMCCPWLYFDGKLFHHTLARSVHAKNLLELCENHIDRVVKVERMRKAILEGLDVHFAKIPLPPFGGNNLLRQGMPPPNCLPPVPLPSTRGPTSLRHRPMSSRGGQLQVAGVVVGSWGANYGYQQTQHLRQPHLVGYGGRGRSVPFGAGGPPGGAFQQQQQHHQQQQNRHQHQQNQRKGGMPTYNVNKKNISKKKSNNNQKKTKSVGRGMTVRTDNGDLNASDVIKSAENEVITSSSEEGAFEDCTAAASATGSGGQKGAEHRGQGDGPPAAAAATPLNTSH